MLLRRVIGDVLRARRQGQRRTLREVSTAANVSLGYLSEIERGQKEASSELLAAICGALGSQLSEVLRDVSDTLALAEHTQAVLAGAAFEPATPAGEPELVGAAEPLRQPAEPVAAAAAPVAVPQRAAAEPATVAAPAAPTVTDGTVSVCVRRKGPLRTTLHTVRNRRPGARTAELSRPT